ncbi:MAG: ATP-binding protein [Burkholderiaceae bacterium]|jgi:hypothetical protein|nr:ATP-binding protein [Burkholderiaceae bacterium]
MAPQDPWHFTRTALAEQVIGMFDTGLSSALTFFAPRRMGKTEFLRKDITPVAEAHGWHVFYFSFLDADSEAAAVFVDALTAFSRGESWLARTSNKLFGRVSKVSGGAGGVQAGIEFRPGAQEDIKAVIHRLATEHRKVLLLLDEVQALAKPIHTSLVAALRTALDMHKDQVKVIFTGSSREGLRRMFSQASAPFFHFGQNLPFPQMERAFTDHLATVFKRITRRPLDKDALWLAFVEMGHVPQLCRALVERMTLNQGLTLEKAQQALMQEVHQGRDYAQDWERCSALEHLLLLLIADGGVELYSASVREQLAHRLGVPDMAVSSVQSALRSLSRRGRVFKAEASPEYEIEDPVFREWLGTERG